MASEAPGRGGIIRSTSKRVKMIFSVMASPNRIDILRILNSKGPLTYSELKSHAGFRSKKESGKFAYHLRKLLKQSLVALNKSEKKYTITNLGKLVLSLARQIEERSIIEAGKMYVRTSRWSIEEFNSHKITQSLVREGGLPLELAQKITEEVENRIYKYQTTHLTSSLIREMVNSVLLEHGHEEYRSRLARLGLPVYDVQETMTNVDYTDGGSTEDLLLRAGQVIHSELLLTNNLSKDVADAYLSGDLHITNPGLWSLLPDIVFFDVRKLVENGIDIGDKLHDVSRLPAAKNLDELSSLISMSISLSNKEASQEVVMDGLVPLLSEYAGMLPDVEQKMACAFAAASTVSRYNEKPAIVSFRLVMGESPEVTSTILEAYKRYAEITASPKIGLIIDYDRAGITDMSERLAEIICLGGHVAFVKGQTSAGGVACAARGKDPTSVHLGSISINLPRLALESNKDEMYFRANLVILMKPVLEAMSIRRRHVTDLIRKGLNPLLVKNTQHMQHGSVSMTLNLIGLHEAVFGILGYEDNKDGRNILRGVINTASDVAKKGSKASGDDIRICMVESDGAARLASLDGDKFGKAALQKILDGPAYSTGTSLDGSRMGEYSAESEDILEISRLAEMFGGGLVTDLEFGRGSDPEAVRNAIERASELLSFFRPQIRPAVQ